MNYHFPKKAEYRRLYAKRDNLTIVNHKLKPARGERLLLYPLWKTMYRYCFFDSWRLLSQAPINLVLAADQILFFDVGCPVLFHQREVSVYEGRKFTIYKLRNMTNETDANGELLPPSQRVTKWGKIARKTSLDELLNFVSV